MKKYIALLLFILFLSSSINPSPVFAGYGPMPSHVEIDDESLLEDDPEFFENVPLFQLKSYTVYPKLQRNKYDKSLKVVKFQAVFEYSGDTLIAGSEQPVIGTAMCKVSNPYYFYDQKIAYKGRLPLEFGEQVSVIVLIPFPGRFAAQLRKNPATCNVTVNDANGFPITYNFEVQRVGKEFKMTFRGTNSDRAPQLDDPTPTEPVEAPSVKIEVPAAKIELPPVTAQDHIRGSENAPLTFIEYSDVECPFCQRFHPTMKKILKTYDGKVRWVYRHFPLSFHLGAQDKAEASECANELGGVTMFWQFVDRLLETNPKVTELSAIAAELGLNQTAFESCLQTNQYEKFVMDQMQGGTTAGITGTPTSFLVDPNGLIKEISGAQPYEAVSALIEDSLKR